MVMKKRKLSFSFQAVTIAGDVAHAGVLCNLLPLPRSLMHPPSILTTGYETHKLLKKYIYSREIVFMTT